MIKFSSRKSVFFSLLIFGMVALVAVLFFLGIAFERIGKQEYWLALPFTAIISLFLWIYFGTYYKLTDTELIYRSGPIRGRIVMHEIREIVKGKTMYSGLKPATAAKGLIIKFRKYDEIYISPVSNESFIAEIGKRNPHILISES
ncbi:MAG: PH domain-containing protein [Fluviicola sp.]